MLFHNSVPRTNCEKSILIYTQPVCVCIICAEKRWRVFSGFCHYPTPPQLTLSGTISALPKTDGDQCFL